MPQDSEDHAALSLEEGERSDYLAVVGSLVRVDGVVDPGETRRLSALCRCLSVSAEAEEAVLAASQQANRPDLDAKLERIRKDPALCYALMIDAIVMVMADGRVVSAEADEIRALGRRLNVPLAQTVMIGRYVESVLRGETDTHLSRELSEGLFGESKKNATSPSWIVRTFRSMRGSGGGPGQ